jgi:hypothetical protein
MPKIKDSLTKEEQFCLDAFIINRNADMAYLLSRPKPSNAKPDILHRMAMRWLRSKPVKEYIERQSLAFFTADKTSKLVGKFRSKDSVLSALEAELPVLRGKDRLDALMKIADLQQMKREETQPNEERVHFYLPMPMCEECPNRINLWNGSRNKET